MHAPWRSLFCVAAVAIHGACSSSHPPADASPPLVVPDGAVSCPVSNSDDISLLPKGKPCASNAPVCNLTLTTPCDGPTWAYPGATNAWTCACKDEHWDCVVTSLGLGTCDGVGHCPGGVPVLPPILSASCAGCCDTNGVNPQWTAYDKLGCFDNDCVDYFTCLYCTCTGTETQCKANCASHLGPQCEACYIELANCGNGPCQSECAGQPFLDAGVTLDATVSDASDASNADSAEAASPNAAGDP